MAVSFKSIRPPSKMIDEAATRAALTKNMRKYGDFLIQQLQAQYKDIPEGTNYQRRYPRGRGGVGGGWRKSVDADGNGVTVYNDVPYARFVQGHLGEQSSLNREVGWLSIDEIAAATRVYFNEQVRDSIREGIAKARQNRNRKGQFV